MNRLIDTAFIISKTSFGKKIRQIGMVVFGKRTKKN